MASYSNLKTKLYRLALVMAVLFLFSISIVTANPTWLGFGNSYYDNIGISGALLGRMFMGSSNPNSNMDFTVLTISQTSIFQPIVYDLDSDGINELYLFSNSYIYQYDNTGTLVTAVNIPNMCGNAMIATDTDGTLTMVVVSDDLTGNTYHELSMSSGTLTESDSELDIAGGASICDLVGGIDYRTNPKFVFTVENDGDVLRYDISNNGIDIYSTNSSITPRKMGLFQNGLSFSPVAPSSGEYLVVWGSTVDGSSKSVYANTFNTITEEFKQGTGGNLYSDHNLTAQVVTIGSQDAQPKIIITAGDDGAPKAFNYYFFDLDTTYLTMVLSNQDTNAGWGGMGCTADVDYDGLNEWCYVTQTAKFSCLDETLAQDFEYTITTPPGNGLFNGYFSCAEFSDFNNTGSEATLEIVSDEGIHVLDHVTNKTHQVYDANVSNAYGMALVVRMNDLSSYIQDILWVSGTQTIYYTASGTPAQCGDGICSPSESSLTCFADCGVNASDESPTVANESIGSFGHGQTCSADIDCFGDMTCIGGFCQGLQTGAACNYDFQCASGECTNDGFCTKPDFVTIVQDGADNLGFTSSASKYFLALLLVLLGAGVGAGTLSMAGAAGATIGGIVGLFLGSIMSVVVFGWIGAAVVFMILFVVVVIAAFMMMFRGG